MRMAPTRAPFQLTAPLRHAHPYGETRRLPPDPHASRRKASLNPERIPPEYKSEFGVIRTRAAARQPFVIKRFAIAVLRATLRNYVRLRTACHAGKAARRRKTAARCRIEHNEAQGQPERRGSSTRIAAQDASALQTAPSGETYPAAPIKRSKQSADAPFAENSIEPFCGKRYRFTLLLQLVVQ